MEGESTLTTNNEGGSSSLPTTHSNDIVIIIPPAGALPEIEVEYEQHLESYHRTVSTIYFLRRLIIEEFDADPAVLMRCWPIHPSLLYQVFRRYSNAAFGTE